MSAGNGPGRRAPAAGVVTAHPVVEAVLGRYAEVIGADLPAYRHHVYRGLTYQLRLLEHAGGPELDGSATSPAAGTGDPDAGATHATHATHASNADADADADASASDADSSGIDASAAEPSRAAPNDLALAWSVHDLGIWTAGTFDYIPPSVELARTHAAEAGVADVSRVVEMVERHHQIRPAVDPVVESFRRADLVDLLRGTVRGRLGRDEVRAATGALPYCGFHRFLVRRTVRHAARHPLRPLPMYRW